MIMLIHPKHAIISSKPNPKISNTLDMVHLFSSKTNVACCKLANGDTRNR
uniref:Uncharacterized protein n=1 Tax=Arundo donax TaxID=35708 RepID=A0A0A9E5P7_ARUDO